MFVCCWLLSWWLNFGGVVCEFCVIENLLFWCFGIGALWCLGGC